MEEKSAAPQTCPKCGAHLAYDILKGQWGYRQCAGCGLWVRYDISVDMDETQIGHEENKESEKESIEQECSGGEENNV